MKISIIYNNKSMQIESEEKILISKLLQDNNIELNMPCNGNGTCGKCKVIAKGNLSTPSEKEADMLGDQLNDNIRLSCMTYITGDAEIEIIQKTSKIVVNGFMPEININPVSTNHGIAIDIGTTTVACYLFDLSIKSTTPIATISFQNPQVSFGSDVISRIQASIDGDTDTLQEVITSKINDTMSELCSSQGINKSDIEQVVITGNTTMMFLALHIDVEPLSHAPFEVTDFLGKNYKGSDFTFKDFQDTNIYVPNTIEAFVGSDITCSILSSNIAKSNKSQLMLDAGTNGEMAVFHDGKLYVCSTAAGPAFEGAGVHNGVVASTGAINKVYLEDGKIKYTTISNAKPTGICGSGFIDAVATLLKAKLVDETGLIDECNEEYEEYLTEYDDMPAVKIGDSGMIITQKDVRALQLSKSALCAGMLSLLNAVGLDYEKLDDVFIAGGFGNFIDIQSAATIGLIPFEFADKCQSIGNAAGMGACMILLSQECKKDCEDIYANATHLDLSSSAFFQDAYIDCMMFPED